MKFYIYKITFEDLPGFFYFGFHKHNNDMDFYLGSPKTWKHFWNLFGPQKQVLQWFETEEEARRVEKSIIRATWEDPLSLNENCGGAFSSECVRKLHEEKNEDGKSVHAVSMGVAAQVTHKENGTNFFDPEFQSEMGKRGAEKAREMGVGIFDPNVREEINLRLKEEGRGIFDPNTHEKGRETQRELQVGIFDPEKRRKGLETQKQRGVGLFDPEKRKEFQMKATAAVSKPVLCVKEETGEKTLFPSFLSAEKQIGVSRKIIKKTINTGQSTKGFIFTTP